MIMTLALLWAFSPAYPIVPSISQQREQSSATSLTNADRKLPGEDADAAFTLGIELYDRWQFNEAAAAFEQAARLDPTNAVAFYNLGLCYQVLRKTPKAEEAFRNAIRADPDWITSYPVLARLLIHTPNDREIGTAALDFCRSFVERWPESPEAHRLLGLALVQLDRDKEALAEYRNAVRLKPDYAEAYADLGQLYSNSDRHAEAIKALETAIRFDPDLSDSYSTLCRVYLDLQNFEAARRVQEELRRVNPHDAEWIDGSIKAGETLKKLRAAVKLNPRDARSFYEIGTTYFNQVWQYEEAAIAFRRVLKLQPGNSQARYYLGVCYVQDGKTREAKRELNLLQKQDPVLAKKLASRIAGGAQGISFGAAGVVIPD